MAIIQQSLVDELDGRVEVRDERFIVRFDRVFDVDTKRLWTSITRPSCVRGWLGPVEKFDPYLGGNIVVLLHPKNGAWLRGTVIGIEPRRMIEFTWSVPAHGAAPHFDGGTLRLEVHEHERGSRLSFAHSLPGPERVLDILSASHLRLQQLPPRRGQLASVDRESFLAMRQRYEAARSREAVSV